MGIAPYRRSYQRARPQGRTPPVGSREVALTEDGSTDCRQDRVYQPCCRVFRTPVFNPLPWAE